eukprot:gene15616-18303_t
MLILGIWVVASTQLSNADDGSCQASDPLRCSLNGDCIAGQCRCDPAWNAHPNCDALAFDVTNQTKDMVYHNASGYSSWGGNVHTTDDGVHHLFVAQFANKCPLGDWGSNSMVVRATSSAGPAGPFAWAEDIILPFAHNPTVRELPKGGGSSSSGGSRGRGRGTLYGSGIFASHSPTITGPWSKPVMINFTDASPMLSGGGTNPSPHINPDGTVTLAFQMQPNITHDTHWELVGVSTGPSWKGPFTLLSPNPVSAGNPLCVAGTDEDPFLWKSPRGFHMLTHGMCPSGVAQAHYMYSVDGIKWTRSPRQAYFYEVHYMDGSKHIFDRME